MFLRGFFKNTDAQLVIAKNRLLDKEVNKSLDQVEKKLNGDSRYFLRVCDSEDPEEKNCPPFYGLFDYPD